MNINGYNIFFDFLLLKWVAVNQNEYKPFETGEEAINYCKGEK